jgi:hypothetical protein
MKKYYELLGLTENATDEELETRYKLLREQYKEERWLDGEAGNNAAKALTKLDAAYKEIMASRKEKLEGGENGTDAYAEISELLKQDKIAEAQARLDDFNERPAEWHYLQAVVFYKKNWTNESKKQLEVAMEMEPDNIKYRAAYGKMNAKNDFEQQSAYQRNQNPYSNPYNRPYDDGGQMGGNACTECISCCYTYMCINCLFNLCCGCH